MTFPDRHWLTADPTTPTGLRLKVPDGIFPAAAVAALSPGARPEDAEADSDGFSPVTPTVFELPDLVYPETLRASPQLAQAWDVTTGKQVPVVALPAAHRMGPRGENNLVVITPATRYEFGHEIVVSLRASAGVVSPGNVAAADARLRELLQRFDPATPLTALAGATSFVVRSRSSISSRVEQMVQIVRAQPHPVEVTGVGQSLVPGTFAVTGRVQITDFRAPGGEIPRVGAITHQPQWVDFIMTLPFQTPRGGAPVMIYGHGLTLNKETLGIVASDNAHQGVATIAIDVPNHGSRSGEGTNIVDLANPWYAGRMMSMPLQGELDELSLLLALPGLRSLDVAPFNWLLGSTPDGRADLNPGHVLYSGTSMGSVLGSWFIAMAPEVDGAFYQVGGAGLLDTLHNSVLWVIMRNLLPQGLTPAQEQQVMGVAQLLLDRADSVNFADRTRPDLPVTLAYSPQDHIVPAVGGRRLARLLGLHLVGEQLDPIEADNSATWRVPSNDQSTVEQLGVYFPDPFLQGLLAHASGSMAAGTTAYNNWLRARLSEPG
jgi:hypothetical protein